MASDSELIERLREILSTSDLNTATNSTVRRKLEEDFGIDLSERKLFIREQVDAYMQTQFENEEGEKEESVEPEEADDDDGEEDDETAAASDKKRKKTEVKKRGGGGGFTKVCSLSPALQEVTGVPEMARTEVVKQLWAYIKQHDLQDPENRRNILCDDKLRNIFGVKKINMFQMNKSLTKHIWPVESENETQRSAPKEKQQKQDKEEAASRRPAPKVKHRKQDKDEDDDEPKRKHKSQKGGSSGLLAPLKLSDGLVKFLGTGESELCRSDVVKRIWTYIKQHGLQDPSDKRQIICDEKLKELFNVETFNGFGVAKYLTAHFIKPEQ